MEFGFFFLNFDFCHSWKFKGEGTTLFRYITASGIGLYKNRIFGANLVLCSIGLHRANRDHEDESLR